MNGGMITYNEMWVTQNPILITITLLAGDTSILLARDEPGIDCCLWNRSGNYRHNIVEKIFLTSANTVTDFQPTVRYG